MKRYLGWLLLSFCAAAHADVVYDTVSSSGTQALFAFNGIERMGDTFFLAAPSAGMHWRLDSLDATFNVQTAGTYIALGLTVNFYNGVETSSSSTHEFIELAGSAKISFGNFVAANAGDGLDFTISNLDIDLAQPALNPGKGYGIEFVYASTSAPGHVATAAKNTQSIIDGSSSTPGIWYDKNNNKILEKSELDQGPPSLGWQNTNMRFRLSGTQVPEPGMLGGLAVPLLLRRRSKR